MHGVRSGARRLSAIGLAAAVAIGAACGDFTSSPALPADAAPPDAAPQPADAASPWDGACDPGAFCDSFERPDPRGLGWEFALISPEGGALRTETPPWSDAGGRALLATTVRADGGGGALLFHSAELGSRFGVSFRVSVEAPPRTLFLGPAFLGKDSTDDTLGLAFGSRALLYQADGARALKPLDLGDITPRTWYQVTVEVRRATGEPSRKGTVFVTIDGTTVETPLEAPLVPRESGVSAGVTSAVDTEATVRVDDFVFFNEP
jgi:hypothetical protein